MASMDEIRSYPVGDEYLSWLHGLRPRTCLIVHWLADMGALPEPGPGVRRKALRFAGKRELMVSMMGRRDDVIADNTLELLGRGDFEIYSAWLMWLRFQEYIPGRFVLPGGREKILAWIRSLLRRPELNTQETLVELQWQVERMLSELNYSGHELPPSAN